MIGSQVTKPGLEESKTSFKQIRNMLAFAKDPRDTCSQSGVYRARFSYIWNNLPTKERNIKTRKSEHKNSCQLGKLEKPAVDENEFQEYHASHTIKFDDTTLLLSISNYYKYGIPLLDWNVSRNWRQLSIKLRSPVRYNIRVQQSPRIEFPLTHQYSQIYNQLWSSRQEDLHPRLNRSPLQ